MFVIVPVGMDLTKEVQVTSSNRGGMLLHKQASNKKPAKPTIVKTSFIIDIPP